MNASAKFWNKVADGYAKQPIADEAAYQKKLQVTREYFQPSMNVLELGCGTGSTAIAHAPYVQHIQAIDFSSNMIEIAQAKADAQNIQNITFLSVRNQTAGRPSSQGFRTVGLRSHNMHIQFNNRSNL